MNPLTHEFRGRPASLWVLLGLSGTLGVRGLVGGGQFVLVPSGAAIGVPTEVLAPTPFDDFLLPGAFLFCALGAFPLVVSYGLYAGRRWAPRGAIAVGVLLTGWALLEGFVLGFGERLQAVNLLQGVVMTAIASHPSVRDRYGT